MENQLSSMTMQFIDIMDSRKPDEGGRVDTEASERPPASRDRSAREVGLPDKIILDYRYWAFHTAMILTEPILCSRDTPNRPGVRIAEIVVIILSTLLLLVQMTVLSSRATASLRANRRYSSIIKDSILEFRTFIDVLLTDDEVSKQSPGVLVEVACLLCGWVYIFYRPGVAVLRCFRLFRVLFYHDDLPSGVRESIDNILACVLSFQGILFSRPEADKLVRLCYKVMIFAGYTLKHMVREMFMLDRHTKGGFILIVIFFYSGWVLGIASWLDEGLDAAALENTYQAIDGETQPLVVNCNGGATCLASVYRLSLWDGSGFDFLWSLRIRKDKFLFAVLVVYMCGTAFGVLNGLTGVFRNIYGKSSRRAFVKNSKEDEEEKERTRLAFQRKRAGLLKVAAGVHAMRQQIASIASAVDNLCERRSGGVWRESLPPAHHVIRELEPEPLPDPAPPLGFRAELVSTPPPSPGASASNTISAADASAADTPERKH